MYKNNYSKILLNIFGIIFLFLGALGVFLPLLPTTPFLIGSAYCFAKSSKKMYNFIIYNKVFGTYIRNYKEGAGISLGHKIFVLFFLWITISTTAYFFVSQLWIQVLLLIIAISVTIHLFCIKTFRKKAQQRRTQLRTFYKSVKKD